MSPAVSQVASPQQWTQSPAGQHIELGIAENNLFIMLAALGLSHSLFGARLLPIGTVYDPFICRGLDALNYACYQDARFILAGTPSGLTLAPEGGAHQSIYTPLIGMGQPNLVSYEPAFADDLTEDLSLEPRAHAGRTGQRGVPAPVDTADRTGSARVLRVAATRCNRRRLLARAACRQRRPRHRRVRSCRS
ncbi:MAG: hypothetical protein QM736_25290 [Vicinamibacterales bacterium]